MAKKDRKPKPRLSAGEWSAYGVRCADGSPYPGITGDVTPRCRRHNDGAASRYAPAGVDGGAEANPGGS
jgi:predicted GIY-YIG superfamily endonuclease